MGLPTIRVKAERLRHGVPLPELVVEAGFARSKTQARRAIEGGAIRINDVRITDPRYIVTDRDFNG